MFCSALVCCSMSSVCVCGSSLHPPHFQIPLTAPGVPYFVRVMVNESQRGIGLPGKSEVFFSEELGM